jgi:lysyl-tRNA synthetase class II
MRQSPQANRYRDAWTGELTRARAGSGARVSGWVHRRRDHGGLIFIDLRDRSGLLQLVFHPDTSGDAFARAERLRAEHVVSVAGRVVEREAGNVNPNLPTGEIELSVTEMEVLAESETPPFPLDDSGQVDETLRLTHRALDLRRDPCATRSSCATTSWPRCAASSTCATSWRSRRRSSPARRPRARATSSCPAGCSPAPGTRCPSRRSSSSSC